jgi:hypothetical protein
MFFFIASFFLYLFSGYLQRGASALKATSNGSKWTSELRAAFAVHAMEDGGFS